MAMRLPELIEPLRLAEKGIRLNGNIEIARMLRLGESLCDKTGQVIIDILFFKEEGFVPCVKGTIKARLKVICQRCVEPMEHEANITIKAELLEGERAIGRLEGYEPLAVAAEPMSLVELIEDELILALPIAPMHSENQCFFSGQFSPQNATLGRSTSPFAVLSKLKVTSDH